MPRPNYILLTDGQTGKLFFLRNFSIQVNLIRFKINFNFQGMIAELSLVIQIVWAIILELGGRFTRDAKRSLKSWKCMEFSNAAENKLMSKIRKAAAKPMVLGEEGTYKIARQSVLKFLRSIVKGSARAILTIGK